MSVQIYVRVRMKVEVAIIYTEFPLIEKIHMPDVLAGI